MRVLPGLLSILPLIAAGSPLLNPAVMHDDFHDGGLSQWASYPPVQDIGYDPSLAPAAGGGIMRTVRAPSTSRIRMGFIKRTVLVAPGPVPLAFRYRVEPAAADAIIEAGIAYGSGRREVRMFPVAAGDGWHPVTTTIPAPQGAAAIDAVFIVLRVPHPDPGTDQRFFLEDVDVRGAAKAEFTIAAPAVTRIAPWPDAVSEQAFSPGDSIRLAAAAPVSLARATATLIGPDGRMTAEQQLERRGERWIAAAPFALAASAPTGIWHAELRGATPAGDTVETRVRLLVRLRGAATHPRLYFDAAGRQGLAARARDPRYSSMWEFLAAHAAAARKTAEPDLGRAIPLLDSQYLLPSLPAYFDVVGGAGNRLLDNALDFAVTGNPAAAADAKRTLLEICAWPTWTPPWFAAHGQHTYYPVGELMTSIAFAYDVLPLSGAERSAVRDALVAKGIAPVYREYVIDNRLMANTSNWIGHCVGGAILAVLAILDDDGGSRELDHYLGGLLLKFEDHLAASYLADGSYGEGISYQEFDLKTTSLALVALERVAGVDYWSRTHVRDSYRYALHAQPLDTGDSHAATGYSAGALVQHSSDPLVRRFYERLHARSFHAFLFPVAATPPAALTEPAARIFDDKGVVIFRSGWDENATQLLYRAGPTFNHNHADQGLFLVRAFGKDLVTEAGVSQYYNDPWYALFFTQAAGHSTILVDGDPASQDVADTRQFPALNDYPRLTSAVAGSGYQGLTSDLAPVYKGRLEEYTRSLVFLPPGRVIICDDLHAAAPARFDWRLHVADMSRARVTRGEMVYDGGSAAMVVSPLGSGTDLSLHAGHIVYAVFNPAAPKTVPRQPAIFQVHTRDAAADRRMLTVLTIAGSAAEATRLSAGVRRVDGAVATGVAFDDRVVLFRAPQAASASYDGWQTDAASWSVGPSGLLGAQRVTRISRKGRPVLSAGSPISLAVDASTLTVESAAATTLEFDSESYRVEAGRHTIPRRVRAR